MKHSGVISGHNSFPLTSRHKMVDLRDFASWRVGFSEASFIRTDLFLDYIKKVLIGKNVLTSSHTFTSGSSEEDLSNSEDYRTPVKSPTVGSISMKSDVLSLVSFSGIFNQMLKK